MEIRQKPVMARAPELRRSAKKTRVTPKPSADVYSLGLVFEDILDDSAFPEDDAVRVQQIRKLIGEMTQEHKAESDEEDDEEEV